MLPLTLFRRRAQGDTHGEPQRRKTAPPARFPLDKFFSVDTIPEYIRPYPYYLLHNYIKILFFILQPSITDSCLCYLIANIPVPFARLALSPHPLSQIKRAHKRPLSEVFSRVLCGSFRAGEENNGSSTPYFGRDLRNADPGKTECFSVFSSAASSTGIFF